jgi:hypothetical protein
VTFHKTDWQNTATLIKFRYEARPEIKDTSRVGREGNFLCLVWQHCSRPWFFTCEPCSFGSGRTSFVWLRRVWNGSPAKSEVRSVIRFLNAKGERTAEIHKQIVAVYVDVMNRKMWRSGAVNSPKGGLMFSTNKGAVGHLWSLTTFFRKLKENFAQIGAGQNRVASHQSRSV